MEKNFFSHSLDMCGIIGFDGYFKLVNPAWTRILGWTIEELSGNHFLNYISPDDRLAGQKELEKLKTGTVTQNFTSRFLTKAGHLKMLSWNINVCKTEQLLYAIGREIKAPENKQDSAFHAHSKLEKILQNMPNQILEINADGQILYINRRNANDQDKKALIGASVLQFLPPHEHDLFKEHLQAVLSTGQSSTFEVRTLNGKNDGFCKFILLPLFSGSRVDSVLIVASDLSSDNNFDKKQKYLVDDAMWLKYAIAEAGIVDVADKSGVILYVNDHFEKLSGYHRDELIGKKHAVFHSGKHPQSFYTDLWQTITRGQIWKGEVCNKKKSGEYYWVDTTIVPYIGANGEVERFVSLRIDITERKKIEAELKSSEQRLKTIMEHLHDPIWLLSLPDGRVKYTNEKPTQEVFGYSTESFYGDPRFFEKLIHPEDLYLVELANQDLRYRSQAEIQYRLLPKSGETKIVNVRMKVIYNEKNEPVELLGITRDITEQMKQNRLIEEQTLSLAAKAKMSALGEMAGGIGHEINNPIGIINARARHIVELLETSDHDLEKIRKFAEIIHATSLRVVKIVQGLKTFARDSTSDPPQVIKCGDLVDEVLLLCGEKFRANGINITVAGAKNVELQCYPVQIEEVLLNLLSNAFDALGSKQGAPSWVRIDVQDLGENVEIAVTDSGKGIPQEISEKIMNPFFTTKKSGKGTGLGLSISTSIVKKHGGNIYYDNTSQNTRFIIVLPKVTLALESDNQVA